MCFGIKIQGFVRSLQAALREGGTLVQFADHHDRRLHALLETEPDEKSAVRSLLHRPSIVLSSLLDAGVYHPGFQGSFELRPVAAALTDCQDPTELDIADERAAQAAFRKLSRSRIQTDTRGKLKSGIEACCKWCCAAIQGIYGRLTVEG